MRKDRWGVPFVMAVVILLSGCVNDGVMESGEQVTGVVETTDVLQTVQVAVEESTVEVTTQIQATEETEEIPEAESLFFKEDGKQYSEVPDLVDGKFYWVSVVDVGKTVFDSHGHETVDYSTQTRWFKTLDNERSLTVRRWDNLMYSAGDYLIYEYDGIIHVADSNDLYHPIVSYDKSGTMGMIYPTENEYMVSNERTYEITFYDRDFQIVREINGFRSGDGDTVGGHLYMRYFSEEGLMAVRDMETGLMGFMDMYGELKIPCQYALVSSFVNGYASVLTDAELVPYTEDGGTVAMFDAQGGNWGIIDTDGEFVIEPDVAYANQRERDGLSYYNGISRFSPVREDGTCDFELHGGDEDQVLATVQVE